MENLPGNVRGRSAVKAYPVCEPRRLDDPLDKELANRLNDRMSRPASDGLRSEAPVLRELAGWMVFAAVFCGLYLAFLV